MRAIVVDEFGPPGGLRVAEVPAPVPSPGEVLVETHAAPVNYVDMLVVSGTYQFLPPRPFIPGKGPAGLVAALGPGVTTLGVGTGCWQWLKPAAMPRRSWSPPISATCCRRACRLPKPLRLPS